MTETGKKKRFNLWLDTGLLDYVEDIGKKSEPKIDRSDIFRLWINQGLERYEKAGKFTAKEGKLNGRGTKRR